MFCIIRLSAQSNRLLFLLFATHRLASSICGPITLSLSAMANISFDYFFRLIFFSTFEFFFTQSGRLHTQDVFSSTMPRSASLSFSLPYSASLSFFVSLSMCSISTEIDLSFDLLFFSGFVSSFFMLYA